MEELPFKQRMGLSEEKPIEDAFPINARIGLAHIITYLDSQGYVQGRHLILAELYRRARLSSVPEEVLEEPIYNTVLEALKKMEWYAIYEFCERLYDRLLCPAHEWNENNEWAERVSLSEVKKYFTSEINLLLAEENIAYHFIEGQFQRRGHAQTQKSIQRMGSVLSDPALSDVRQYFHKARKFFNQKPEPDSANCIKEALCALEACLSHYYKEDFSLSFVKSIKQHQGNDMDKIPNPIAEGIIKLYAYRGSGQGVAHAAPEGTRVSDIEAELILNLVASYITYIVDIFAQNDQQVPF